MSRSVSFSDDVVSHVFYIPRIDEESKGDYFYSQREIERFQRIWQNAYMELVRRKEQEKHNSEAYSKRKHFEMGCTMSCGERDVSILKRTLKRSHLCHQNVNRTESIPPIIRDVPCNVQTLWNGNSYHRQTLKIHFCLGCDPCFANTTAGRVTVSAVAWRNSKTDS